VDGEEDEGKIFKRLLEEGVIVRPMGEYGLKGFIRVSIGKPWENELFIHAFEKIRKKK
jgi:histidinol-phosphate aminotransferase